MEEKNEELNMNIPGLNQMIYELMSYLPPDLTLDVLMQDLGLFINNIDDDDLDEIQFQDISDLEEDWEEISKTIEL